MKEFSIFKRGICLLLSILCFSLAFCMFSTSVSATEVNNVTGSSSSQSSNAQESSETSTIADGLADAFRGSAVTNKDIAEASRMTAPAVNLVRTVISIILALISVVIGFITVVDLLYLMCPPVRSFLSGGQQQTSSPMGGGMMGAGMGMGMGAGMGMGGGMMSPQQNGGGGTRIVSDEAIAALNECTAQQGGMNGMMGGAKPKAKIVILAYAKKRIFVLICFFACLVLFTSTVFTDIGLHLGQWIVNSLGGML